MLNKQGTECQDYTGINPEMGTQPLVRPGIEPATLGHVHS
jgi:hypothetical protein